LIIATNMLMELYGCRSPLDDAEFVESTLMRIVDSAKLTALHHYFHSFDPPGVTGIIALQESHISIHTWPAQSYAVVDFLTCGSREHAMTACRCLETYFEAETVRVTETQCVYPAAVDIPLSKEANLR